MAFQITISIPAQPPTVGLVKYENIGEENEAELGICASGTASCGHPEVGISNVWGRIYAEGASPPEDPDDEPNKTAGTPADTFWDFTEPSGNLLSSSLLNPGRNKVRVWVRMQDNCSGWRDRIYVVDKSEQTDCDGFGLRASTAEKAVAKPGSKSAGKKGAARAVVKSSRVRKIPAKPAKKPKKPGSKPSPAKRIQASKTTRAKSTKKAGNKKKK